MKTIAELISYIGDDELKQAIIEIEEDNYDGIVRHIQELFNNQDPWFFVSKADVVNRLFKKAAHRFANI